MAWEADESARLCLIWRQVPPPEQRMRHRIPQVPDGGEGQQRRQASLHIKRQNIKSANAL
eukprot:scaffold300734_cov23-Prasinocladus_malaysianus.AAC.1